MNEIILINKNELVDAYDVYVQADCDGQNSGNLSGWLGPLSFTSLEDFTGINNLDDITFQVYPNPNNGDFNIVFNHDIKNSDLLITDIQGKVLFKSIENFDKNIPININLPSLAKGIYLIEIKHNGESWIQKVTVN